MSFLTGSGLPQGYSSAGASTREREGSSASVSLKQVWGCSTREYNQRPHISTAQTVIPFPTALVSSQLKSVWLLHIHTVLKRNTKQREGVQQSASQILWSQEGTAFLQPDQQKANPGATCSLLKGALR